MASVVIKCPNTGKQVPTGFNMDESSFKSNDLSLNTFTCSECGNKHTWNKDQASLEKTH